MDGAEEQLRPGSERGWPAAGGHVAVLLFSADCHQLPAEQSGGVGYPGPGHPVPAGDQKLFGTGGHATERTLW